MELSCFCLRKFSEAKFLRPLLTMCICFALRQEDARAEPTVGEIRQALEEYQREVNSLNVVYSAYDSPDWKFQKIDTVPECEWTWLRSGRKRLLKSDLHPGINTMQFARQWMSFDGLTGYMVGYYRGDNSLVQSIEEAPFEPLPLAQAEHLKYALGWGAVQTNTKETVVSLLGKASDAAFEEEVIDGISYPGLRLGQFESTLPGGPPHRVIVWFSPRHGFLPKRIAVIPVVETPPNSSGVIKLPQGSVPTFIDVLEYREVEDPLFKKIRWFPQRIRTRAIFSYEITIRSVEINGDIPASAFVPEKPIGTEIIRRAVGSTRHKVTYEGGEEGERIFHDRLRAAGGTNLKPVAESSKLVDASPPRGISWSFWFGVGTLLLFGLAFVASRRRAS